MSDAEHEMKGVKCPVCGGTAPEPRWLCLARIVGEAKQGEFCGYSLEGMAKFEAKAREKMTVTPSAIFGHD